MLGLFKKRLKPTWQFTKPNGWIWRALFIGDEYLIGEFRQSGERKASFFLLNAQTGALLWDNFVLTDSHQKPVGDGWWVGMETVYAGLVYFHGYYSPNVPEHLGIWAMEPSQKAIKWVRPDLGYLCISSGKMVALRNVLVEGYAERSFLTLNPLTGEEIDNFGQNAAAANFLRNSAPSLLAEQEVVLSEQIAESSPRFAEIAKLAKDATQGTRVIGAFDVLEHHGQTIIGYHEQTNQMVTNQAGARVLGLNYKLFVLDSKQNVIYSDILGELMSGLLVDGFFVRRNRLYYVKERNTLCAIDLP